MRRAPLLAAAAAAVCAAAAAAAQGIPPGQRRSGFADMAPATQGMQRDDAANPAMLWVQEGEALWSRREGAARRSCADCHGDAAQAMRGVAARHPAWDDASGGPLDLEDRINRCRTARQGAEPFPPEAEPLLALSAYVALQSRGLPIAAGEDPRLAPAVEQGRRLFAERRGQLDLSCAQCHDENWGRRLAGNAIPQGHPTGYPLYRLEWQGVGSLRRRLRNCMAGVRSEPYAHGAPEVVALELYLTARARGMPMEAPACGRDGVSEQLGGGVVSPARGEAGMGALHDTDLAGAVQAALDCAARIGRVPACCPSLTPFVRRADAPAAPAPASG